MPGIPYRLSSTFLCLEALRNPRSNAALRAVLLIKARQGCATSLQYVN
jgi:hypothetical protein